MNAARAASLAELEQEPDATAAVFWLPVAPSNHGDLAAWLAEARELERRGTPTAATQEAIIRSFLEQSR